MGFSRRKGFVEGTRFVSIEIVQDHANDFGVGIAHIDQPLHLLGKVLHRALRSHGDMPPSSLGLTEEKKVAGPVAFVFVIVPCRVSRLRGQRLAGLADQLFARFIKGHRRAFGIIGLGIQIQHVFHCRHKLAAHLG
jgi:hypothetical protein